MKNDVFSLFLGELSPAMLVAGSLMTLLGVFLSLLLETTKRDPMSERTPTHFSWEFLWCDNAKRIYKSVATSVIVVFLSFRFANKLIGQQFSMFYCLLIGLALDAVVARWKQIAEKFRSFLKTAPVHDNPGKDDKP